METVKEREDVCEKREERGTYNGEKGGEVAPGAMLDSTKPKSSSQNPRDTQHTVGHGYNKYRVNLQHTPGEGGVCMDLGSGERVTLGLRRILLHRMETMIEREPNMLRDGPCCRFFSGKRPAVLSSLTLEKIPGP